MICILHKQKKQLRAWKHCLCDSSPVRDTTSTSTALPVRKKTSLPFKSCPAHLIYALGFAFTLFGQQMCFPTMEEAFPCSSVPLLHVDKLPPRLWFVLCSHGVEASGQPYHLATGCTAPEVFRLCAGWEWLGLLWKTVFTTVFTVTLLCWEAVERKHPAVMRSQMLPLSCSGTSAFLPKTVDNDSPELCSLYHVSKTEPYKGRITPLTKSWNFTSYLPRTLF